MAPPVFFWLSLPSRPPALGPRRRIIAPTVERTLRGWIHDELRKSTAKLVEISEWVSLDSRAVPHTVSIIVETEGTHRYLGIEIASERIVAADVRAALVSRGLCGRSYGGPRSSHLHHEAGRQSHRPRH